MKKIICPKCGLIYSVSKCEKTIVTCGDCKSLYFQEQCGYDTTILDYIKPKA
jgi:hypothetical protein